jgi:hypothetical protein
MTVPEVRNRATINGAIEIGRGRAAVTSDIFAGGHGHGAGN